MMMMMKGQPPSSREKQLSKKKALQNQKHLNKKVFSTLYESSLV